MNQSQQIVEALVEFELGAVGRGIGIILKDVLVGLMKRGIFRPKDVQRVLKAWKKFPGTLEKFQVEILPGIVTPRQFKFFQRDLAA